MKPYVSIDIETTGLDPETCQILEIGAVIDDWEAPIDKLPTFRRYIDPGKIRGEPLGLSMNADCLKTIAEARRHANSLVTQPLWVAAAFESWLLDNGIDPKKRHLTCAGKNFASFDRPFLLRLPGWNNIIPMQHRSIEPGMLYWDPKIDDGLPSLKTCMERASIPGDVAHTAVEDALVVVKLIRHHFGVSGG